MSAATGHMLLTTNGWECQAATHGVGPTYWCEHIKDFIESGADAAEYHAEMRLVVPIFPEGDVFAQIHVGEEVIPNGAASMELRHTPEIGREKVIPLGLWNPGEGMRSIRAVVIDTLRSMLVPEESLGWVGTIKTPCPLRSHPIRYTAQMNRHASQSATWKRRCLWSIAMEGACLFCAADASGVPDNFGVDPNSVGNNFRPNRNLPL